MADPMLLLRMEGPLQSWGTRARWDVRDTATEPTKSGVVGMLGAALGYAVGDRRLETELDRHLAMAVRVEHEGRLMVDYHTVTGYHVAADGGYARPGKGSIKRLPDEPATVQSRRSYLQDAAFLVVLAGPGELLQRCRDALARPRWPLFLGRKSCPPARPVLAETDATGALTERYAHLEDAVGRHEWDCQFLLEQGRLDPYATGHRRLRTVIERPGGPGIRRDAMRVNPARMYDVRNVAEGFVDNPGPGTEACS